MAYTVLARRYRSGTFDELVGQQHVAQTLKRAIAAGRIAHAFLFCGTRGTGKTSVARILAKALNCLSSDRPTPDPCGTCSSCTGIARGDDLDYVEIDAASHTGVDNVREVIIGNAAYRPALCRFKIFLIDEVHMLSKSSFNALLKTLEEPPEHVKFILATTEPEKIPATILSRCQRYDFRNIHPREVAAHLRRICQNEGIVADDAALLQIARAGGGSMRDSLSLLDRLLSVGEKTLTAAAIEQLLGVPPAQQLEGLVDAVGRGQVAETLTRADELLAGGLSPDTLVGSLIDFLHQLLLLRACGADSPLLELTDAERSRLSELAKSFDVVVLSQDLAILEELRRQLRSGTAGRALLDATLVRLALAGQFQSISELLAGEGTGGASAAAAGPSAGNATLPAGTTAVPAGAAALPLGEKKKAAERVDLTASRLPAATAATAGSVPLQPNPPRPSDVDDSDADDELPRPGKVWATGGPSLVELMRSAEASGPDRSEARPQTAPPPPSTGPGRPTSNVEPVDERLLPQIWQRVLDGFRASQPGLLGMLAGSEIGTLRDGCITIRCVSEAPAMWTAHMDRDGRREKVAEALSALLGQPVGVRWEVQSPSSGTTVTAVRAVTTRAAVGPAAASVKAAAPKSKPSGPPPDAGAAQEEAGGSSGGNPPAGEAAGELLPLTEALKAEVLTLPTVRAVVEKLEATLLKVTRA